MFGCYGGFRSLGFALFKTAQTPIKPSWNLRERHNTGAEGPLQYEALQQEKQTKPCSCSNRRGSRVSSNSKHSSRSRVTVLGTAAGATAAAGAFSGAVECSGQVQTCMHTCGEAGTVFQFFCGCRKLRWRGEGRREKVRETLGRGRE